MEGLLDFVLRDILTRVGGIDRCVSEFIRITDQLLPERVFIRVVPELLNGSRTPAGVPVRAQLLGSDAACMADNAARLAASRRSLGDLAAAAAAGLPIVAECGGLLLLGRQLEDAAGHPWPMAGVLPFGARRGSLSLGYRQAEVQRDGLVLRRGERIVGHEFHRWQLLDLPPDPTVPGLVAAEPGLWQLEGWGVPAQEEGWSAKNVHASWLHLHWAGCPEIPQRLVAASAAAVPWNGGSNGRTIASTSARSAGI